MSEWWTYRLHDFLMFSPRAYARMHELYNEAIWPINVVSILIASALLFVIAQMTNMTTKLTSDPTGDTTRRRLLRASVFAYFAIAYAWIAWVFLHLHYAPIFWFAEYFAYAFIAQAALFGIAATLAIVSPQTFHVTHSTLRAVFGIGIASLALVVHPAISFASQKTLSAIEAVGVAPDTTAIAVLGFMLLIRPGDAMSNPERFARYLWRVMIAVAIVWCAVSLLTLIAIGSNLAIVPAVAVLGWLASIIVRRPSLLGKTANNHIS